MQGFSGGLHPAVNKGTLQTCPPSGVEEGQLLRIVIKYLQDHAQRLHERHWFLIADALSQAFPCPATTQK
jgi:hypothetical protein